MGNCLKHQSSTKYTTEDEASDDDWDFQRGESTFAAKPTTTKMEVKIKITKKQLEELLRKMDVRELKVDQVMTQLKNHSSGGYQSFQRPWRPALQSIPESN